MDGYTNIVQLGEKVINELRELIEEENLVGIPKWDNFISSLEQFREAIKDPLVAKELNNYKIERTNGVERLGLSKAVIKFIEDGLNPREIQNRLGVQGISVTEADITSFLKEYENSDIISKIEKSNTSVFDTEVQLQTIFDELLRGIEELGELSQEDHERLGNARVVKEQLYIEFLREKRQALKDASELARNIANVQIVKNFNNTVLEEVRKESPACFQRIMRRINESKSIFRGMSI